MKYALFLALMALLLPPAARAADDCPPVLVFSDFPGGEELLAIPLGASDGHFELSYRHSVFKTIVRGGYLARDGDIHQIWETYSQPGWGMGASPGMTVSEDGAMQKQTFDRPLPKFVLRLQKGRENHLDTPLFVDLNATLGDRATLLSIRTRCAAAAGEHQ